MKEIDYRRELDKYGLKMRVTSRRDVFKVYLRSNPNRYTFTSKAAIKTTTTPEDMAEEIRELKDSLGLL